MDGGSSEVVTMGYGLSFAAIRGIANLCIWAHVGLGYKDPRTPHPFISL